MIDREKLNIENQFKQMNFVEIITPVLRLNTYELR